MAEKNNYYKHSSVLITYLHYCVVVAVARRTIGGNCKISSLIIIIT